MYDPLDCAVNHVIHALKTLFDPDSVDPPMGGGTTDVRFLHADGVPLAWFDAHLEGRDCSDVGPYIWVRVENRYLSSKFPAPDTAGVCGQPAAAIEVGIARCSYLSEDGSVDFDALMSEANVSLDDSRRLEKAMCLATARITGGADGQPACGNNTARDILQPWGPEGGAVAWMTTIYVQLG